MTFWTLSFYPQIILNTSRRSVTGLSLDFVFTNILGHLSYLIYTLSLYYSLTVRAQYRERHEGNESLVRGNDVAYTVHAAACSCFIAAQTIWFTFGLGKRWDRMRGGVGGRKGWEGGLEGVDGTGSRGGRMMDDAEGLVENEPRYGGRRDSEERGREEVEGPETQGRIRSRGNLGDGDDDELETIAAQQKKIEPSSTGSSLGHFIILACLSLIFILSILIALPTLQIPLLKIFPRMRLLQELDLIYLLGYVKLVVTIYKHFPQLYLNYRTKSIKGWSILGTILDIFGSVLSVAQLFIDAYRSTRERNGGGGDEGGPGFWKEVSGDFAKLGLGGFTLVNDFVFLLQFFVWYRGSRSEVFVGFGRIGRWFGDLVDRSRWRDRWSGGAGRKGKGRGSRAEESGGDVTEGLLSGDGRGGYIVD